MLHRWASPQTILVATNLHDSLRLVPHAITHAKCSGAKVLLVHLIEPSYLRTNPAGGVPFLAPGPTLLSVVGKLNQIVKQFQQEALVCEPIALRGVCGEVIPALVREREIDRVIVATRSADTLDRILLGSVAEDLLHQLEVPVCVVGPHVCPQIVPDRKPASILVATSLHYKSQTSVHFALELANLHHSRLTLLHVMSAEHASEEERQGVRRRCRDDLAGMLKEGTTLLSVPSLRIREGDPSRRILAMAAKLQANLVVLGANSASRSSRLLAPGVVHRVIAEAKAPVITVRQEQGGSSEHLIPAAVNSAALSGN
jgi:nucleotide-binding universal stress UspA family protein